MAEGLFKEMLKQKGYSAEDIKVQSAGVFALEGDEASDGAIKVMHESGIDIEGHRAQRLTPSMIREADIIFAMTKNHRDAILSIYPSAADKTYVLSEYGARFDKQLKGIEIGDPYGQSVEIYRQSAQDINKILEAIIDGSK